MTHLLAIDPGKKTGIARFVSKELCQAALEHPFALNLWPEPSSYTVLIEMPRWYPHDHKDVNDLLDLSVLVGEYKRHFEAAGARVELVWPRTWKGTAPKEIMNRRALAGLTSEELALVPRRPRAKDVDHNVADAIGLGLWKLGRL